MYRSQSAEAVYPGLEVTAVDFDKDGFFNDEDDASDSSSTANSSPTFQLPTYLSSSYEMSHRQSSNTSSPTSTSSGAATELMSQQRLVLLAKHPNANEASAQHELWKQERQQQVTKEVAKKKSHDFRQQQMEGQQPRLQGKQLEEHQSNQSRPRRGKGRPKVAFQSSLFDNCEEEEEIDDVSSNASSELHNKSRPYQTRNLVKKSNMEQKSDRTLDSTDDEQENESFLIWQPAGQVTSEIFYTKNGKLHPPIRNRQMLQHQQELSPPPAEEDNIALDEETKQGISDFVVNLLGKIFPSNSNDVAPPPSSGASILSDSMDARSTNTANDNKSHASKASLPSHCSEKTRKINNLSPKNSNAPRQSIPEEDFNGDGRGQRLFRLVKTRNGLIILALSLIVMIAVIVTIAAAISSGDKKAKNNASNQISGSAPASAPTFDPRQPTVNDIPTITDLPDSVMPNQEGAEAPTATEVSFTAQPTIPIQDFSPFAPSLRPSLRPTSASTPFLNTKEPTPQPTASPTLASFVEWTWTQRGLLFQGEEANERYGQSVAISEDGNILAIGAPYATINGKSQAGFVEVFQWDDVDRRGWITKGLLQGRNAGDQFGSAISLSADGSVLAVSEPTFRGKAGDRSGGVRVFVHSPFNGYEQLGQDLEGDGATDHFGIGLAMSANGRRLAVGAPYHDNSQNGNGNSNDRLVSGQAKVFDWSIERYEWVEIGASSLQGESHLDWFGWSLDLSDDGSVICVGAPRNLEYGGYVQCFVEAQPGKRNTKWQLMGDAIQNTARPVRYDDNFGTAVRIGKNATGNKQRVAIGSPGKNKDELDAGLVVVYEYDFGTSKTEWYQIGQDIASPTPGVSQQMGSSLDLQGDLLAIGIPGVAASGQVNLYHFQSEEKEWQRHSRTFQGLEGSNYGSALRITKEGDMIVGSPQSGNDTNFGIVNVYQANR